MKQVAIIALVAITIGSGFAANYCGVGKCAICVYIPVLAEDRSCTKCVDGPVVAVSGALASKCDNEGKPANCARLRGGVTGDTANKDCIACNEGFNYVSSSKSCAEQATKIENAWGYVDGVLAGCKPGYYQDGVTACVKATEIKDCYMYGKVGSDVLCSRCNKNFKTSTDFKSCIADDTKGCINTTVPCSECDVSRGWYAVDLDLSTGQKCEYSAKTLAFGSILAVLVAYFN